MRYILKLIAFLYGKLKLKKYSSLNIFYLETQLNVIFPYWYLSWFWFSSSNEIYICRERGSVLAALSLLLFFDDEYSMSLDRMQLVG